MLLLDGNKHVVPEGLHLFVLQPGFVVHPELDGIDFREHLEEFVQRGFGVGRKIVRRHAPYQAGNPLTCVFGGARNTAALHSTAIDVIPDAGSHLDAALVRDADHGLECGRIVRLLLRRDSHHLHAGELLNVEEERIQRRHEAAVLVAEDHDEAVDAAGGQHVEIAGPVPLVVQPALEIGALHRVRGDAPRGNVRLLAESRTY